MKHLFSFSIFLISLQVCAQSSGEKTAWKLDSIAKADKITKFSVYFQLVDKEVFVEYFEEFKFDGHLLILIDPNKEVRYYNLDKLIHWTIKKKDKILKLYFQRS